MHVLAEDARFWRRWALACFYGWFFGLVLLLFLAVCLESAGFDEFQFFIGVSMGAGVGYMQWRLLSRYGGIGSIWFWYSVAGMGSCFLLFDLLKYVTGQPAGSYYLVWSILSGALLTGVLQSRVLKPFAPRQWYWIPGCLIAWLAATATALAVDYIDNLIDNNWAVFFINIILLLGGGMVLGLLSRVFLRKIIRD